MYGLATIQRMNAEAARNGAMTVLKTPEDARLDRLRGIKQVPEDCGLDDDDMIENMMVDSSGFGAPGELAYTQDQFSDRLQEIIEEHGPIQIGMTSQGQFQVYVGVWPA
jgi:hypothetical protein